MMLLYVGPDYRYCGLLLSHYEMCIKMKDEAVSLYRQGYVAERRQLTTDEIVFFGTGKCDVAVRICAVLHSTRK